MALVVLLVIVFVFFLRLVFPEKEIHSKYINFFKFLFPSWCFFDESTDTPFLMYQINQTENWETCFPPKSVRLYHLFHNPDINLYMAFHSHMQQMVFEIFDHQNDPDFDYKSSVNYLLVKKFLNYYIRKTKNTVNPIHNYQFKISFVKKGMETKTFIVTEDILISPLISWEKAK
jgi:hypothetical protein